MDRQKRRFSLLDAVVFSLLFSGILLLPIHPRAILLYSSLKSFRYINYLGLLALLLSLFRIRKWETADYLLASAWCLLMIPVSVSNINRDTGTQMTALAQSLLPLFLVFYRMGEGSRKKALLVFLICFDIFMVLFLALGIEERFSGLSLLIRVRDNMASMGLEPSEFTRYLNENDGRFASVWGHPLTGAFLFNAFFVLNAVWLRNSGRKRWIPLIFLFSLTGALLCSSKMGIVVCFMLLLILFWEQKKWFLLILPVMAGLYLAGLFDSIIYRFTNIDLTSGRLEALAGYFSSGLYPLRFLTGYSSNNILQKGHPLASVNDAFEFPLMMFSFDYGMLFAAIAVLGVYAYVTRRMLRNRNWVSWLCYSCLFAEVNVYNAYALRNQDVCWMMCIFTLFLLNAAELLPGMPKKQRPTEGGASEIPDQSHNSLDRASAEAIT